MKNLIEFPLEDGTSIFVEVDNDESDGGVIKASRSGEVAIKASQTFESALEKVKPIAQTVISKLRSLHDSPDEVEVGFGLKLNAGVGAVVASTSMEANYTITLRWKKEAQINSKKKRS